jgi:hypothetical protein
MVDKLRTKIRISANVEVHFLTKRTQLAKEKDRSLLSLLSMPRTSKKTQSRSV